VTQNNGLTKTGGRRRRSAIEIYGNQETSPGVGGGLRILLGEIRW
jgi:hypothetical protein